MKYFNRMGIKKIVERIYHKIVKIKLKNGLWHSNWILVNRKK